MSQYHHQSAFYIPTAFACTPSLLQSLPLLRSVALRGPSMDSSDLSLENRVDKTMARKHVLALELRGNNHSLESLATAAYTFESGLVSKDRIKKEREKKKGTGSFIPSIELHTGQVFDLHMLSLQLLDQLGLERVRRDPGCVGHSSVDGGKRARGERERCPLDGVRTEEITAASVQDSEGGRGAEEHQARSIGGASAGTVWK